MKTRSLRLRLALWYALAGSLLLGVFSVTIYLFVSSRLVRPLDHQLREDLAVVRAELQVDAAGVVRWNDLPLHVGVNWPTSNPWFELWDADEQLVARRWPFAARRLDAPPSAPPFGRETISLFSIAPGVRIRSLAVPFHSDASQSPWMLRVMRPHEPAVDALQALLLILLLTFPVVVGLLVLGGYVVTRQWLRPLEAMVRAARQITAADLGRRLPQPDSTELCQLAAAFNATLARLEDSFSALDRFVADAAHELRTPLTALRSVGELSLRRDQSAAQHAEAIGSMLEEAQRLEAVVAVLLQLARAEGGAMEMSAEPVQLVPLLQACAEDAQIVGEERGQEVHVTGEEAHVVTDPVLLRQALQNLVDNALKYAPDGTSVELHVAQVAGAFCIEVRDRGPGIPAALRDRVTERFFRIRDGRETGRPGTGLGLALTKAYARVLGGQLLHFPREGGGSIFRLLLPVRAPRLAAGRGGTRDAP